MIGLPQIMALIAVAVWAVLPVLIKHSVFESNIALFLVIRFTVSSVLLAAVLRSVIGKMGNFRPTVWLGFLLLNGLIYFLQTLALQAMPATLYIVLFSLTPILCFVVMRIKLNAMGWLFVAVTLAACIWFTLSGGESKGGHVSWTAMFVMLGGMLSWVVYSAFIKRVQSTFNDIEIAGLSGLFGLLAAVPVWAVDGFNTTGLGGAHVGWAALIGLIVPIGYYAYSYALRTTPVFAITSQYFEPILALAVAVALTTETINLQQAVAAVICISAAVMVERKGAHVKQ